MAEIIRNWKCLNARCGACFTSWEANPECPTCRCVRVQWIPGGGHVAGTAAAADGELRKLSDLFGMTNMNSAERGRAAKQVALPAAATGPSINFGPGFSAPIRPDGRPTCQPTTSHVDFKAKVGIGNKLAPSSVFPSISRGTSIEASHRPPK